MQGYKTATDPYLRNIIGYLLAALSVLMLFEGINFIPVLGKYSVNRLGHLLNALIIGYAIWRPHPLDITLVMRKALTHLVVIAFIGGVFTCVLFLYYEFLPEQPFYSILLLVASAGILLALVTHPLQLVIQGRVDRLFYRGTLRYREALLNLTSKLGNILNLEELADQMLPTMIKALLVVQAKLLVEDDKGDFTTQYTYPKAEAASNSRLHFSADSPMLTWLGKENTPLELSRIGNIPELQGLPNSEREQIAAVEPDLLCPIKSRGHLVGILALGGKQSGTLYTYQDIQLILSVTGQIGLMIENARLYSQALSWALTDGLTGLYNHRHFHKILEQEIARCSRQATVLSLIMMDLDHFKAYNDTFGHLEGDKILRGMGECLTSTSRSGDTAFRYGGEEFAVILPGTSLENAFKAAERIREATEHKLNSEGMSVTVSLGIASWPADGVTKEDVIACADAALYLAKQMGRNRACLSSELDKSRLVFSVQIQDQSKAASIVYALAAAVDAKDHYTNGHSNRVGDYSVALASMLNLPPNKIAAIRVAGLLHDVGKIGIPDSILKKGGSLTNGEWEVMKTHPKHGVDIVKQVAELNDCLPAILHHHEHFDGKGYPSGLQGDNIPFEARILAIADTYDALTSSRHYRERQFTPQDARKELKRSSTIQFDPDLVDIFCKIIEPTTSSIQKPAAIGTNSITGGDRNPETGKWMPPGSESGRHLDEGRLTTI